MTRSILAKSPRDPRALQLEQSLARQLYRRLQARPFEKRRRPLRMSLTSKSAPLLYDCSFEETCKAWAGVEALVASGFVGLRFNSAIDTATPSPWRGPVLEVAEGSLSILQGLADKAGIPRASSFETLVITELARQEVLEHEQLESLWNLRLSGFEMYSPPELARRLGDLIDLAKAEPSLYLREASARLFNGNSKLLDGREDLVVLLTGRPCPWKESPVQLTVSLSAAGNLRELVFVENLTTFERLSAQLDEMPGIGFIYCAGWKGSAERAASKQGRTLYYSAPQPSSVCERVDAALDGSPVEVSLFFFGDLDFSGMGILASLRKVYPTLQAWRPGYWELMLKLERGESHAPSEADKQHQLDPKLTGCPFADAVLLPALRRTGRCVDQEAV